MRKITKIFLLIVFIFIVLSAFSVVNAASADIVAKPTSVNVGETVTVTVTVDAAAWNLKVSGSASGKIIGYNGEGINETTTKTYTIDTSKAGTYTVSVIGDVTDQSKTTPDIINKSVNIEVKEKEVKPVEPEKPVEQEKPITPSKPETPSTPSTQEKPVVQEKPKEKSTNAYLSTLGITPKEYDFSGFKKTIMDYSVTIPYDVDSVKVLYKTADSNAKVKVTGNSGFEVGSNNKITIKVTAEDGKTTKTYTIKVTKLAEVEEKPGNIIDEEIEGIHLTELSLKGIELSPEFSKDIYSYTAKLSDNQLEEVEVNAIANDTDAIIEISGNTNLVIGENTINIVVKQKESTIQTVYQITLNKEMIVVSTTDEEVNFISNLIDNIKNYVIIAVIVIVAIISVIILLIILLRKENKKIENVVTEEYNVYQNDENEFNDNEVKEGMEEITSKIEKEESIDETKTKNERRTRRKEKGRHAK